MRCLKIIVSLCILIPVCGSARSQNYDIEYINKEITENLRLGYNVYCSNLLVEAGNFYLKKGDTLIAYELQMRNCILTDQHLEDFFNHGLTWDGYFANWYVTISLAGWLGYRAEIAPDLIRILKMIEDKAPQLLPLYSSSLGYVLHRYTDTLRTDYIKILQSSLDYIKGTIPNNNLVEQYNRIVRNYYTNHYYYDFDSIFLKSNHFNEIEDWYYKNRGFFKNLNQYEYRNSLIQYDSMYIDELLLYASSIGAQYSDNITSNKLYYKALSVLEPLSYNPFYNQKKAYCYAEMATNYSQLGDLKSAKECIDSSLSIVLTRHINNYDFCSILDKLSLMYYTFKQSELAGQLKLLVIQTLVDIGMHSSITDWEMYYTFILDSNPDEIIKTKDYALLLEKTGIELNNLPELYFVIGKAYSALMKSNANYRDSAELYFYKSYEYYNNKLKMIGDEDIFKYNYYQAWAKHYLKLKLFEKAYDKSKEALLYTSEDKYPRINFLTLMASYLHEKDDLHYYLPKLYSGLEKELLEMLPILGSTESESYLEGGEGFLYHIPEWASWNPTDSVSVSIAYDAALLMKGLTLRYNTISPYLESHPNLAGAKLELDRIRDSIYSISDENTRLLALHRYKLKEREILKDVNAELTNVHWKDIANKLKNDDACVEFVKYTADAYSWCDSIPKPHYSVMVLLPNGKAPIFVDLFDEDELMDVYNLQPKSYDIKMGQILYSQIWGKLQPYIDGKRKVFISPMGLLNLINIELLIDSTGRTAMDRFNLYRVSSTRNIQTKDTDIVAVSSVASFGGVDYENANEYAEVIQNINTRGNWSYLQNSLSEVNQIESLLQQRNIDVATYRGANATEDAFKHLDGTKSNVIHIASHGYYIPQSNRDAIPYFSNSENTASIQDELFYSGLILSGGQKAWVDSTFKPDNNDGILSAYEISKLDLHNVDLVVLSACETGLGDNLFDGIFGLQRAFKKAGVKSILMSLWQIDDKATSEYMTLFYEKLINGYSVHDAYNSTVLMMKEKYQDANYWASFVLLD